MTNPGFVFMPLMTTVMACIGLGVALYLWFNDRPNEQYENAHDSSSPPQQPNTSSWSAPRSEEYTFRRARIRHRITSTGEQQQCTICWCEMEESEDLFETPCKHSFHLRCILQWQNSGSEEPQKSCPICRQHLRLLT